jgi:ADP-heptose:LPS heptosyltransferase
MNNELKKKVDAYAGNLLLNLLSTFKKDITKRLNPNSILLIKFWGIGNIVMLTPSLKAIREKYPRARVYFLTLYNNRGLIELLDYVDEVIYYKLGGFDIFKIINLIIKYYKKFDIVIDFEQFLNASAILTLFLGRISLGFSNKTRSRGKIYDFVEPYEDKVHMVEQFYSLCRHIGVHEKNLKLESFDFVKDSRNVNKFFEKKGIDTRRQILLGVHIGSSENAQVRRWPPEYFIELMNILNRKAKNLVFVITGVKSERATAASIVGKVQKGNCYNSCGVFSLKDLIFFIKNCDFFISNDTGPIHFAAALGVRCVGFYGPNTPLLYGPYGKKHLIFYNKIACSPCISNFNTKSTSCRKARCIESIKPLKVAQKMTNYIKKIKRLHR